MTIQKFILITVAVLAFSIGLWAAQKMQVQQPQVQGMLPEAKNIAAVALENANGQPFVLEDFAKKWTVVSVGYTSCPDICPDTLYKYKTMKQLLAKTQPALLEDTQFVFVSVDPYRDTPEQIKGYLAHFDPEFVGVTGSSHELEEFAREIFAQFEVPKTGEANYEVAHSGSLHIIGPDKKLFGVVMAPFTAETALARLLAFRKYYEAS